MRLTDFFAAAVLAKTALSQYAYGSVSACIVSTVTSYVPIHLPGTPDATTTVFATHTQVRTVTSLVRESSSEAAAGPTYFYTVNDGTTSWLNGSPIERSTITSRTTVTVQPAPATSTAAANGTATSQEAETTIRVTSFQTVRQTITNAVTLTTTPGPGTSGWNSTTSAVTAGPTGLPPSGTTIVVSGTAYSFQFPSDFAASSRPILSTAITVSQGVGAPSSSLIVNATGLTSTSSAPVTLSPGATTLANSTTAYGSLSYAPLSFYGAPPSTLSFVTTASGVTPTSSVFNSSTAIGTATPTANATSSLLPTPTLCGESGNFTINWDDTPNFTPTNGSGPEFPPVFNPYHHMFYAQGYGYVPPSAVPFAPVSQPHLAIYSRELADDVSSSPNAGSVRPGEIGAGPRASISAFWFDAFSVFLGCENEGPGDCTMTISGYTYDAAGDFEEKLAVQQSVSLPPCPRGLLKCNLTPVELDQGFRGLSGIRFEARLQDGTEAAAFLLDNMVMGWADNSCAAGLLRQRSRK